MGDARFGPPRGREDSFVLPEREVVLLYALLQDPVVFAARENRTRAVSGTLSLRLQGGEKISVLDLQQTAQESVRDSMLDAINAHDAIGMIPYHVIPTEQRMIIFGANGLPLTDAETFDAIVGNRAPDYVKAIDGTDTKGDGDGYDSDKQYFGDALSDFQVAPSTVEEFHDLLERQRIRLRSYNRKIRRKQREEATRAARSRSGAVGLVSPYSERSSAYSLQDVADAALPYSDAKEWISAWLDYAEKASAETRMSARSRAPWEPPAKLAYGHDPYAMSSRPDGSGPRLDELHYGFRDGDTVRAHQKNVEGGSSDHSGPRRTETRRVSDLVTSPVQTLDPRSGTFTMIVSTDGTRRMEFKIDSVDTIYMVHVFDGCWPEKGSLQFVSPASRLIPGFMRLSQVREASIQAHVFSSRPTILIGEHEKANAERMQKTTDIILQHVSPATHAEIANANHEFHVTAVQQAVAMTYEMDHSGLAIAGKDGSTGAGSYNDGSGAVFKRVPEGSTVISTVSNSVQVGWEEFNSAFVRAVSGEFKTPPSFLGEENRGSRVDETERDRTINELGVEDARRIAGEFFTDIYKNAFGERDHRDAMAWLAACGMPHSHFDIESYPGIGGDDEEKGTKRDASGNDMALRGGDLPNLATPDQIPDDVPLEVALGYVGKTKSKGSKNGAKQRRKLKGSRSLGGEEEVERVTTDPLEGIKRSAMAMLNGDARASVVFPENPYRMKPDPAVLERMLQIGAIATEDFYNLMRDSVGLTDVKFAENARDEGVQSRKVALEMINGPEETDKPKTSTANVKGDSKTKV